MADYIFPSSPKHISEIPLWLTFISIPYKLIKDPKARNILPYNMSGDNKIAVPFNGDFVNINALNYTSDTKEILALLTSNPESPLTTTKDIRLSGLPQLLETATVGDNKGGRVDIVKSSTDSKSDDHNVYLAVDMMDMMYMGGGHKSYEINLNLICQDPNDSLIASKICSVFSSMCWPTVNILSQTADTIRRVEHPNVWVFWISSGPFAVPKTDSEKAWVDGVGPMMCVLEESSTRRVGGENNRILGMATADRSSTVPIQYSVNLQFTELEPTFRDPRAPTTINRSIALISGSTIPSPESSPGP